MVEYKLPSAAAHKITVSSTAGSVTSFIETAAGSSIAFPTGLNQLEICPENYQIRFTTDGTAPTATNGTLVRVGDVRIINAPVEDIQIIRAQGTDASCSVRVGFTQDPVETSFPSASLVDQAYNSGSNAVQTTESNPLSQQYSEGELIDTTNVAAATNYYPSADGFVMDGYNHLTIQGIISGGVTATVEATNDDAASPDWSDITLAATNLITGAGATASYVDTNFFLRFNDLRVKKVRVKSVTSDASNAVQYHYKVASI